MGEDNDNDSSSYYNDICDIIQDHVSLIVNSWASLRIIALEASVKAKSERACLKDHVRASHNVILLKTKETHISTKTKT